MMRQAIVAGGAVLVALTIWAFTSTDDVRDTLVSVALVAVPILAITLGVIWALCRYNSKRDS